MSYRYEQYADRRPRSGGRCLLVGLTTVVGVVLVALLLARYVARPLITQAIEQRIAQQMPELAMPNPEGGVVTMPPIPAPPVDEAAAPLVIPVTEADANQWVQDNREQLQGIDNVVLHFEPGVVTADLTVGGFTATARSGAEVQDGRIRAINPELGPPLNLVVDLQPFVQLLETRLNSDLDTLGRRVTGLAIEQGQMTITLD